MDARQLNAKQNVMGSDIRKSGFARKPLTDSDIDLIIKALKTHKERLCFIVLYKTGMRVSEFANLKKENVYFDRNIIVLTGKGGVERKIPMSNEVHEILMFHFLLYDDIGMSARTTWNTLNRLRRRAGVVAKVSPHVLRHTMAVNALRKGVDIRALRDVLGHSSISVTEIYLRYTEDNITESFRKAGW